jgi:hypothetical protein
VSARTLLERSTQPVTLPLGDLQKLPKKILLGLGENSCRSFKIAGYSETFSKGSLVLALESLPLRA